MSIEKEYNNIVECVKLHKPLNDLRSALYEYAMKTLEEDSDAVYNGEYQLSQGSWYEAVPAGTPVIVSSCDLHSRFRSCNSKNEEHTIDEIPVLTNGLEYRMNPNGHIVYMILKDPQGNVASDILRRYTAPFPDCNYFPQSHQFPQTRKRRKKWHP